MFPSPREGRPRLCIPRQPSAPAGCSKLKGSFPIAQTILFLRFKLLAISQTYCLTDKNAIDDLVIVNSRLFPKVSEQRVGIERIRVASTYEKIIGLQIFLVDFPIKNIKLILY